MPKKPKKPCAWPGCPELTDETYCPKHKAQSAQEYDRYRRDPESAKRYGYRWRQIRAAYLRHHPLCERCLSQQRVTLADMVHHIRPLSEGGTHQTDNLMALCNACHNEVHPEKGR